MQVESLSVLQILKVLSVELHLATFEVLLIKHSLVLHYKQGSTDLERSS